jgi:hypothetical protein
MLRLRLDERASQRPRRILVRLVRNNGIPEHLAQVATTHVSLSVNATALDLVQHGQDMPRA